MPWPQSAKQNQITPDEAIISLIREYESRGQYCSLAKVRQHGLACRPSRLAEIRKSMGSAVSVFRPYDGDVRTAKPARHIPRPKGPLAYRLGITRKGFVEMEREIKAFAMGPLCEMIRRRAAG